MNVNFLKLSFFILSIGVQFGLLANCNTQIDSSSNLILGIELMKNRQFDSSLYHLNQALIEEKVCNNKNEQISILTNILDCNLKSFRFTGMDSIILQLDSLLELTNNPQDLTFNYILLKARYLWYISLYKESLEELKKINPNDFSPSCNSNYPSKFYYERGLIHQANREYKLALFNFDTAHSKFKENNLNDTIFMARILSRKGVSYYYLDSLKQAIFFNNQSILMRKGFFNYDKFTLASCYINSSSYNFAALDYKEALINALKAQKLIEEKFGLNHPEIAGIYNHLGSIYYRFGDLYKSKLFYEKSLNLYRTNLLLNENQYSETNINLAALNYYLGNFKEATKILDRTLLLLPKKDTFLRSKILLYKASYLQSAGKEKEVKDIIDNFTFYYQLDNSLKSLYHLLIGKQFIKKNLALSYSHIEKSINFSKRCQIEKKMRINESFIGLSEYYNQIDSLDLAKMYIDTALSYLRKERACPEENESYIYPYLAADGLFKKTQVLAKLFERDTNYKYLFEAFDNTLILKNIYDGYRKSYKSDHSKLILAEETYNLYKEGVPIAYKLYEHTKNHKYLETILLFSESNKSMILLEAVNDLHAKKYSNIPDSLVEYERQIRVDIAYYNEKLFYELEKQEEHQDSAFIAKMYDKIYSLNNKKDRTNDFFQKNYSEYSDLKNGLKVPKIEFIKSNLREDMALIEYFVTDNSLFILLFYDNRFVLEKVEYDFDLNSKVKYFKQSIMNNDFLAFDSISFELYHFLIDPIACRIKDKRLLIVPDGHLNYVPFELLTTEKRHQNYENYYESKYFFVDYPITYNYSAALYFKGKQKKNRKSAAKNFLGFAPTFGYKFDDQFEEAIPDGSYKPKRFIELPWAITEVESIHKTVNGKIYTKEKATKEKFLEVAHNYNILHLATHAFTHDRFPDYSGLVFASPDSTISFDTYLHTNELYNLVLNADITVLSACETGIGAEQYGEGLMCLSRGLAYAGCPSMIASKWPLSDQSTAKLMSYFYKYVDQGYEKDIALQKARIEFMETMHHFIIPPRFWGALAVIGNEEQIDITPDYTLLVASIFGLAFLILKYTRRNKKKSSAA